MRHSARATAFALTLVTVASAGLAACGGGTTTATTSTTTTTTTTPTGASERALYRGWCSLKVGASPASVAAAIGAPFRTGIGPLLLFHQAVPAGVTYAVWGATNYVLDAWYVAGKIYSLTALPRVVPPAVKLGCKTVRKP